MDPVFLFPNVGASPRDCPLWILLVLIKAARRTVLAVVETRPGGIMLGTTRIGFIPRVGFGFLLFWALPLPGMTESDKTAPGTEPAEYTIEEIQGSHVQVLEDGETQWEAAVEGQVVDAGDEVKVGDGSEVSLMMGTETSVHLYENSDLKIDKLSTNKTGGFFSHLQMLAGRLLADVKKNLQDSQSSFEVESNGVVCGVRGTAFEVSAQGGDSQVSTHEGKVEVTGDGQSHMVSAGNFSAFKKGKFQLLRRLDRMETQRFQRWRTLRPLIRQKRLQRLIAIRNHARQPWMRKHPRLEGHQPLQKQDREKNRERLRKKLHPGAR